MMAPFAFIKNLRVNLFIFKEAQSFIYLFRNMKDNERLKLRTFVFSYGHKIFEENNRNLPLLQRFQRSLFFCFYFFTIRI